MSGDFISIAAAGGGFRAYLAVPEAGSGPGLVLFHDISDEDQDRAASTARDGAESCPEGVFRLVSDEHRGKEDNGQG